MADVTLIADQLRWTPYRVALCRVLLSIVFVPALVMSLIGLWYDSGATTADATPHRAIVVRAAMLLWGVYTRRSEPGLDQVMHPPYGTYLFTALALALPYTGVPVWLQFTAELSVFVSVGYALVAAVDVRTEQMRRYRAARRSTH